MASRSQRALEDKNEKLVRALAKQTENRKCMNCGALGPGYVCTTFSIFVCTACSGVHREFTHRIKSVSMATFTADEIKALQDGGNEVARKTLFRDWDPKKLPQPDNSNVDKLRDFIKSAYVDKRFSGERGPPPGGRGPRGGPRDDDRSPRADDDGRRAPERGDRGYDDRQDRRGYDDRQDRRGYNDRQDRRGYDDRQDRDGGHDDRYGGRGTDSNRRSSGGGRGYDDIRRDRGYEGRDRGAYDDRGGRERAGHDDRGGRGYGDERDRYDGRQQDGRRERYADDEDARGPPRPAVRSEGVAPGSPAVMPLSSVLGPDTPKLRVGKPTFEEGYGEDGVQSPRADRGAAHDTSEGAGHRRVNSNPLIDWADPEPSSAAPSAAPVADLFAADAGPGAVPSAAAAGTSGWATFDDAPAFSTAATPNASVSFDSGFGVGTAGTPAAGGGWSSFDAPAGGLPALQQPPPQVGWNAYGAPPPQQPQQGFPPQPLQQFPGQPFPAQPPFPPTTMPPFQQQQQPFPPQVAFMQPQQPAPTQSQGDPPFPQAQPSQPQQAAQPAASAPATPSAASSSGAGSGPASHTAQSKPKELPQDLFSDAGGPPNIPSMYQRPMGPMGGLVGGPPAFMQPGTGAPPVYALPTRTKNPFDMPGDPPPQATAPPAYNMAALRSSLPAMPLGGMPPGGPLAAPNHMTASGTFMPGPGQMTASGTFMPGAFGGASAYQGPYSGGFGPGFGPPGPLGPASFPGPLGQSPLGGITQPGIGLQPGLGPPLPPQALGGYGPPQAFGGAPSSFGAQPQPKSGSEATNGNPFG